MARSTVEVELLALVGDATKTVKRFADDTQKQLNGINFKTTVSAINDGFELLEKTAGRAFGAVSNVISKSISEAIDAEAAIVSLSNALRIQNDFSAEAVTQFKEFASELQRTTTFTDDSVISALALAKSFRATNEEAKQVVRISTDLAARLGVDLQTATFQVSQTLNGFVDKGLAKSIPGLKNLSKEALISGAALKVIEAEVQGSSAALANTFGGALAQTKNALSDVFEELGSVIIQNPQIIAAVDAIKNAFQQLSQTISANGDGIGKSVAAGFIALVEAGPAIVQSLRTVDVIISNIAVSFLALGRTVGAVIAGVQSFREGIKGAGQAIVESLKADVASDFEKNTARINVLYGSLGKAAQFAADEAKRLSENTKTAAKAANDLNRAGASRSGAVARAKDAITDKDITEQKDKAKKLVDEARKAIQDAAKDPIEQIIKITVDAQSRLDGKSIASIGAGLVSTVLKGAAGAKQLIQSVLGGVADILLPGIGGVVSEIVGVLAQGPEEVRKQVTEFAKAIPQIIQNLIDSLPVLIEALARELPPALAKTMPFLAQRFAIALIKNIPQIIKGFAEGLFQAAKDFGQAIIDFIKDAGGIISGISGKDSGGVFEGIPVLGGIGDLFGFAEGGRVPTNPQFEGDRFPAKLNSGEQVLSKDLSSQLERFLSGGGNGGQPLVVNVMVGQQQLARAILDLNRGGFRTA